MSEWENYINPENADDKSGNYFGPRPPRNCLEASECRSCKALILWAVTEPGGKRMPVDAGPTDQGQFVIDHRKRENKLIAKHVSRLSPDELPGRRRFSSHFETCPNRDEHRKSK